MQDSEMTDKAIAYIYENIDTDQLSDWERNFVESTSDQWDRVHNLTEKQREVLGRIWDKQK